MNLLIPPPIVALICAFLIWIISGNVNVLSFQFGGQQVLAYTIMAIGLCIDVVSVALFFKSKTTVTPLSPQKTSKLVVSGLYRFTRNPMYLGLAFLLTGWAIYCGNIIGFSAILLFVFYITKFQILPEEAVLIEKFGNEYEQYQSRVRRWI